MKSKLANNGLEIKPLTSVSVCRITASDHKTQTLSLIAAVYEALVGLEDTATPQGVLIGRYRAVEEAELFAQLLNGYLPRVAQEAQSAIANGLFSLNFEKGKRGEHR